MDEVRAELDRLTASTTGAAVLVTPTLEIALVSGNLTLEAAHLARTNAASAPGRVGESASFSCDDASWLHITRVAGGWVLGLQTSAGPQSVRVRDALRKTRNTLTILLAFGGATPDPDPRQKPPRHRS